MTLFFPRPRMYIIFSNNFMLCIFAKKPRKENQRICHNHGIQIYYWTIVFIYATNKTKWKRGNRRYCKDYKNKSILIIRVLNIKQHKQFKFKPWLSRVPYGRDLSELLVKFTTRRYHTLLPFQVVHTKFNSVFS